MPGEELQRRKAEVSLAESKRKGRNMPRVFNPSEYNYPSDADRPVAEVAREIAHEVLHSARPASPAAAETALARCPREQLP